jgi:hypothetical protein
VRDGAQPTALLDGGDIAVAVRPQQRHTQAGHLGEQHRRRMTVVVVQADAHDRDRGVHRREELGVGIGGAVVRHLQHVRPHIGT